MLSSYQASPEKFYTIQEAASLLNLYPWKLRRAIKKGLIPSHSLFNSRRLVRLSEVVAAMNPAVRS
jgi:excisionase family DNA binding protein